MLPVVNASFGNIPVIFLAGGVGSRLGEVTSEIPKPMLQVNGVPILERLVRKVVSQGFQRIIICVGYKKHVIQRHFGAGNSFGCDISYSTEDVLLGTGGAIEKAIENLADEMFFVANADSYCRFDLQQLLSMHVLRNGASIIAGIQVTNASRYGRLIVDPGGRLIGFQEKVSNQENGQQSGLINAGIYLLSRGLFTRGEGVEALSLEREILPNNLNAGLYVCEIEDGVFIDIGTPQSFIESTAFFKEEDSS